MVSLALIKGPRDDNNFLTLKPAGNRAVWRSSALHTQSLSQLLSASLELAQTPVSILQPSHRGSALVEHLETLAQPLVAPLCHHGLEGSPPKELLLYPTLPTA